jgi:hypothetical protein
MILEISTLFLINNSPDGDLTKGWEPIPGVNNHFGAPSGGPSLRWNPLDSMYYIIEGGTTVELIRTRDFKTWERSPNRPFIQPSPEDGMVSPFAGFPAIAVSVKTTRAFSRENCGICPWFLPFQSKNARVLVGGTGCSWVFADGEH